MYCNHGRQALLCYWLGRALHRDMMQKGINSYVIQGIFTLGTCKAQFCKIINLSQIQRPKLKIIIAGVFKTKVVLLNLPPADLENLFFWHGVMYKSFPSSVNFPVFQLDSRDVCNIVCQGLQWFVRKIILYPISASAQ